jgi:hypothetical protein
MIQLAIFTAPGGSLLADYSARAQNPVMTTNTRGFAECSAFVPMGLDEAFRLYDRPGLPHVVFSDGSSGTIYEGRLEDVDITGGGVTLRAFGYSRAMGDAPYTALWSTTDYRLWRPVNANDIAVRTPDKYNIDTNGRIYLSTKKGQTYTNAADVGSVVLQVPYSSRKIVGFSLDFTINLPTIGFLNSWVFGYATFNEGFTAGVTTTITTGTGAVYNGTVHYVVTACDYLEFFIYNGTTGVSTPAGEDGANFLQILNLRVVTSTLTASIRPSRPRSGPAARGR